MKKQLSHISVLLYLLIFILISAIQLSANPQKISFNTLADIESQALTFVKDSDGFIWIGTYVDGLYRFDGKNLVHYTKASNFILSNNVPAIVEDRDGILWFVSAGGGLTRYDKEQNTRAHFTHDPKDPNTISSNSFFWAGKNILIEDDQGNLWIGTIGGGLNRFNKESGQFFHYRQDLSDQQSLSSDNVRAVYIDKKNRIWVGTEQGLNLLNKDNKTFKRIQLESQSQDSAQKIIMAIYEDSLGTLWIGTENNGLYKYDESQNRFDQFKFDINDPNSIAYDQVSYLSEDKLGNLWISHQNKFSILSLKTGEITRIEGDLNEITMSFVDQATSLVWALTDTGKVLFHNPGGNYFKQYGSNPDDKNSLSDEIVISIFEDSQGIIWISTIKGFNRYDPVSKQFTHFFHDPTDPTSIPSTADYSPGIFEDEDNVFWIGNSLPSALSIFDRKSGKVIKTYYPDPSNPDSLPDAQQINKMIVDSKDSNIMWMSTAKGLVRFNKKTEKFKTFGRDNSWDLFEDEDGFIWISTWGNGIGKFDKQTHTFEYFSHDPANPDSISDNLLVPLFIDSESRIWIGTENGLNLFDKDKKTFKSYKRSDGYPFDAIHSIGEDKAKNLWLGTNAGLVRFNHRTLKARAFTKEDGILSMMFYANNGIRS